LQATDASAAAVTTADGREVNAYVDPYTLKVLGDIEHETRVETLATNIHGTLLIGEIGDYMIEIAAGLGILLVVSGLYLWWPRDSKGIYGTLLPRLNAKGRTFWRDLHVVPAFWVSLGLVFFLISGMSWTLVWGDKMVQGWNTFPAEMWSAPKSTENMESLNRPGEKIVPWNLENMPLPKSGSMTGLDGIPQGAPINVDTLTQFARENGIDYGFWIALPQDKEGVYTLSSSSMSGDVTDARKDLTVHIDQYTGKVLTSIGWADYSLGAKAMAAGIALHQGDMGLLNIVLNTVFCLAVVLFSVSAAVMWWKRRPAGALRMVAPPMPVNMPMWKGAIAIVIVLGIMFPLAGVAVLTVILLDFLLISRVPVLKRIVN
jgi:uncharacterized iron-regulated membrane protein